ncbi:MAG: YhbY family RNA-binding protein [Pseudomonadales bacterium]|nr:YhbY family RNA-binding protein [Pseudomonadales bacterium]NNL10498.1 YhbY family RNA-binding protein [Pseudomonadales bacterium]RZV49977.1 MAG: YhbY family RNA-binding protein [Pseudomonadales bacterium]
MSSKTDSKKISSEQRRGMRQIGHLLKPIVMIGDNGLSESVLAELERALNDHELIKIKFRVDDRKTALDAVLDKSEAELVQSIGNIALVYRAAEKPDPKLSNLLRHQLAKR